MATRPLDPNDEVLSATAHADKIRERLSRMNDRIREHAARLGYDCPTPTSTKDSPGPMPMLRSSLRQCDTLADDIFCLLDYIHETL